MKVLLVITKSEIGGAQTFILNLARSLKKIGFEVDVAAGEGNYLFEELKKYNISFHFIRSLKRDFSIISSINFIFSLHKLLNTNKYDLIHLNSSNTLIGTISTFFLKIKPKVVFTFHGLSFMDENFSTSYLIKPIAKLYFHFFLKLVDQPVFVSNLNYIVSKEANIINNGKVIYNGLDENELIYLSRNEARNFFNSKYNINISQNYLIGSIGRLAYQKNYEFLINNFFLIKSKIPTVKFIIIGNGPYYKKLNKRIKKLGIQNDFFLVGALKDSYKYIRAFDVFTLPSRYEGLSISLIETIFSGIPILASNVGGNSEIVDDEQLYKLNDIDDYIGKLLLIKENPKKYHNRNCNLISRFSLSEMAKGYSKLYEKLVEKI